MKMMSKYLDFRLRLLVLSFMIVKYEDLGYTITNTNINHTTKLYLDFSIIQCVFSLIFRHRDVVSLFVDLWATQRLPSDHKIGSK